MLSLIRWIVLRFAAIGWATKWLGSLAVLVPLAFVLKFVGLPLLGILGVIAAPVLLLLFLFGLPVIFVLAGGAIFMSIIFAALSIGIFALKIFIFVVLPVWLVFKLLRWIFGRCRNGEPRRRWWRRDDGESGSGVGAEPKPSPTAGAASETPATD